jgi:hypothetical protein
VAPSNPYVPIFFITWIALGAGGVLWISRMTDPAAKRHALRSLTLLATVLFGLFAWLISRSTQQMLFLIPVLALIAYLNLRLVKVCNVCASINRPQAFSAAVHCYKCGAKLP